MLWHQRGAGGVRAGLLLSPGEEGGTAEFSGARVSLGVPESSVNSPFPPESWGSPWSVSCQPEQLLWFC